MVVVLVTKNKDGSFATQGDINKLKDNYKVESVGGFCDDIVCAYFIDHHTALFSC
jgi:hypothetical protein